MAVTVPRNFRSLNGSISSRAVCPTAISTTSISPMSTRASISSSFAMVIISVPMLKDVPSTRSPSCDFSFVTVPSMGERMVVFERSSFALSKAKRA